MSFEWDATCDSRAALGAERGCQTAPLAASSEPRQAARRALIRLASAGQPAEAGSAERLVACVGVGGLTGGLSNELLLIRMAVLKSSQH